MRSFFVTSSLALACVTSRPQRDASTLRPRPVPAAHATTETASRRTAPATSNNVHAATREPLEFVITGRSDLPTSTSTAQRYEGIVEATVARLRPALAECLRSLGAPAQRVLRVVLDADGTVRERPPQAYVLTPRVAACVTEVLRGTRLDPAPPRSMPYDLRVAVE